MAAATVIPPSSRCSTNKVLLQNSVVAAAAAGAWEVSWPLSAVVASARRDVTAAPNAASVPEIAARWQANELSAP